MRMKTFNSRRDHHSRRLQRVPTNLSKIKTAQLPSPHLLLDLIAPALYILVCSIHCLHFRSPFLGSLVERGGLSAASINIRLRYFLAGSQRGVLRLAIEQRNFGR